MAWTRDTGILAKMVQDSVRDRVGSSALGIERTTPQNTSQPLTIWK